MSSDETDWGTALNTYVSFSRSCFHDQLHAATSSDTVMPEIILYRVDGSCSMAANALLKELDIPHKVIRMQAGEKGFGAGYEAADGSFTNAEYKKKVNPTVYVPALVVDGKVITENPAILTYIAALKPERELLGSNAFDQIRVLEWLVWLSGSLHNPVYGGYLRPYRFSDDEASHESIKEKGLKTIRECYERIEEKIDGAHAVSGRLTIVDTFLHVFYRWGAAKLGFDMVAQYPRYTELVREVETLQGLRDAMREEGEALLFP